jgi:hypothetical protein
MRLWASLANEPRQNAGAPFSFAIARASPPFPLQPDRLQAQATAAWSCPSACVQTRSGPGAKSNQLRDGLFMLQLARVGWRRIFGPLLSCVTYRSPGLPYDRGSLICGLWHAPARPVGA